MEPRHERDALNGIEVVIEVRDARIPRTSIQPKFEFWRWLHEADHFFLYSRADLLSKGQIAEIREWTEASYSSVPKNHIFFEDCRGKKEEIQPFGPDFAAVNRQLIQLIQKRKGRRAPVKYGLIVGIPRSGKSLFMVNSIRHLPRSMQRPARKRGLRLDESTICCRYICDRPVVLLMDTCGIYPPLERLEKDPEAIYKLVVCGSLDLHRMCSPGINMKYGEIAEFLLHKLNTYPCLEYLNNYQISGGPVDNVVVLLDAIARSQPQLRIEKLVEDLLKGRLSAPGTMETDDMMLLKNQVREAQRQTNSDLDIAKMILSGLHDARNLYYIKKYGLRGPLGSVEEMLELIGRNFITHRRRVDLLLRDFNGGKLGNIILDDLSTVEPNPIPRKEFEPGIAFAKYQAEVNYYVQKLVADGEWEHPPGYFENHPGGPSKAPTWRTTQDRKKLLASRRIEEDSISDEKWDPLSRWEGADDEAPKKRIKVTRGKRNEKEPMDEDDDRWLERWFEKQERSPIDLTDPGY